MKRFQIWSGFILGMVISLAIVAGCTRNLSVTPNPVYLLTATFTNTATNSPTVTPTNSPMPEIISVSVGSGNPTNSTQLPGAAGVPVLEITALNTGANSAAVTSLKLTASGTGNDTTTGINSVLLYADSNGDGIFNGGDLLLTAGTYPADNGALTLNFTDNIPAGGSANLFVVYTFAALAPAGTYQPVLTFNTDLLGTDLTTGGPIQVTGAPVGGAVITIAPSTPTATNSPTLTPTNTVAGANTNTATNSPTKTPTNSPTNTFTKTPTPSITNTPPPGSTATNTPTKTPTNSPSNTMTNSATNTPTNSPSNTPSAGCTYLLNDAELLSGNGGWSNQSPAGSVALTTSNATQGTNAIDVNITTGTGWNKFAVLTGFAPNDFTNVTQVIVDINADATLISGDGGWHQMQLQANAGAINLNSTSPGLVAGANSVTFNITSTGTPLTDIEIIYQSGGSPIGHMYVDNLRVVYSGACPPTPTMTPPGGCTLLLNDMENISYNGNWTNPQGTVALTASNATQGSFALDANITTGIGWCKFAILDTFTPTDFSTATKLIVDIYADATLISGDGGWHQMQLQANTGGINLASNSPGLVAGANSVTYLITATGTAITDLEFIYQSGGTPTGNMYVDNLRVVYSGACPSGGPPTDTPTYTLTPTDTAAPTDTPTITPTPTPGSNPLLIDDFEDNDGQVSPGPVSLSFDGYWNANNDGSSPISPVTWVDAAGGAGGSNYAAHVTSGPVTSYGGFGFNFKNPIGLVDLSGYTGVVFDVKMDPGSGNNLRVSFSDVDTDPAGAICTGGVCNDYHGSKVCMTTSYQSVTVFFNSLAQAGWGSPQRAFKPDQVYGMYFQFSQNVDMGVWIDNLRLTTAAPPAPLSSSYISDFDFNGGGTSINPSLTGYVAGNAGWTTYLGGMISQILPFVQCGGYNSNFGARLAGSFNDPGGVYNSAALTANFYNGATYFNMTGFIGVDFWIKVDVMTASLSFAIPTSKTVPAGNGGDGFCGGSCWDHFVNYSMPAAGAGWTHKTLLFNAANFTRGGWGPASLAPCSNTNIHDGCNDLKVMQLQWSAGSGGVAGTYDVDFTVDQVTFY